MKMREPHIVPLCHQAVAILRELHPVTSHDRYVFPAIGGGGRPLSENTLNGALRRLGHASDQMTSHGFRSIASTLLNERGVNPRPHRATARTCGAEQGPRGIQPGVK
jgi:integrase